MRKDFDKILLVINHSENRENHIQPIYRLIRNFERKWYQHTGLEMEDMLFEMHQSIERLLTRLNINDSK